MSKCSGKGCTLAVTARSGIGADEAEPHAHSHGGHTFCFRLSNPYWTYREAMSSTDGTSASSGYPQQLRVNFMKMQVRVVCRTSARNGLYTAQATHRRWLGNDNNRGCRCRP